MEALGIDPGIFRGVVLVVLLIAFLGVWAWAWSSDRKQVFHDASMLPLEEDDRHIPAPGRDAEGSKE